MTSSHGARFSRRPRSSESADDRSDFLQPRLALNRFLSHFRLPSPQYRHR